MKDPAHGANGQTRTRGFLGMGLCYPRRGVSGSMAVAVCIMNCL